MTCRLRLRLLGWVIACGCIAGASGGADWPQFRGPDRSGVSPETGLARAWPPDGPPVRWRRSVSHGYAGPAVHGGDLFLLERQAGEDRLLCLDPDTGNERWRIGWSSPGDLPYDGALNVPTVGEDEIFALGPLGALVCVDRRERRIRWRRDLAQEFKRPASQGHRPGGLPLWGFTQAPLMQGTTVIVAAYTPEAGLVAYERETGRTVWTSPAIGLGVFCNAAPALMSLAGVTQVVTLGNAHPGKDPAAILTGIAADDGRRLWQVRTWKRYNVPIPQPVATGPDEMFVTGGYGIGCFGLRVSPPAPSPRPSPPGAVARWDTVWTFRDNDHAGAHLQSPVAYQGRLYIQSYDGYHTPAPNGLVCLSFDGQPAWRSVDTPDARRGSRAGWTFENGGILAADGLLFVMDGRSGELSLVEARSDRFTPLATARVLPAEGGQVWAPMALAGGRLYARDLTTLVCLDVAAP